jgi:parallel beta-helix repeat protein
MSMFLAIALQLGTLGQGQGSPILIDGKVKFPKGEYLLPAPSNERGGGAVLVRGDNITVDFAGVVFRGAPKDADPDQRSGVGIEVQGKNITIKNAKVHGYKVGLIARNVEGLKIVDCDFSYNWKQHLKSTQEKEDLSDWMSYHQNESDEWLRYGAGIYLSRCNRAEIKGTTILGGQNGLLMTQSNNGLVWNNNFSYLSSLGIGMYRSSNNRVMHNRIDYCLRGFSYGVYNRGQDSAGILVYEQSNENIFAYNSVTHSGDGFFLWAGQSTMDTGRGGCNGNVVYGNDFSHAPTNGIEATFSKNTFANNLLMECWHGVWGGYSYQSRIIGNLFAYNTEGIALEHGQTNIISSNTFFRDQTAISLWMNENQDPNWGYPKQRDTASRGYRIFGNTFSQLTDGKEPDGGTAVKLKATSEVDLNENRYFSLGVILDARGPLTNLNFAGAEMPAHKIKTVDGVELAVPETELATPDRIVTLGKGFSPAEEGRLRLTGYTGGLLPVASSLLTSKTEHQADPYYDRFDTNWNALRNKIGDKISVGKRSEGQGLHVLSADVAAIAPKPLPGGLNPFLKPGTRRGWRTMIVDDWGPYDFRRPLIRVKPGSESTDGFVLELIGPAGRWEVSSEEKVRVSQSITDLTGKPSPATAELTVKRIGAGPMRKLKLRYFGPDTVDAKGVPIKAGTPIELEWQEFRISNTWNVMFRLWDPATQDPRKDDQAFRSNPVIHSGTYAELDFAGYGRFATNVPGSHFATIAETVCDLPDGKYEMLVTADDGVRAYVDDRLVIADAWKYQGPTEYIAKLEGGRHRIRVEHFQIDGYAALKVRFRRSE